MTDAALTIGCALLAFGPFISLFSLIVYQKSQLVIVVTSSAFFFLLAALAASFCWWVFHAVGLKGPLAALLPGVFMQFVFRCAFVALYHRVEAVIQTSLQKQHEQELRHQRENGDASENGPRTEDTVLGDQPPNAESTGTWTEAAKLRLELNDAACGVAAGVGYGGMHAILLYGTLLASETGNNVGVLYQESCPVVPSLVVSALYAFFFSILDVFWMLFTFFGMRRRLMYHRGEHDENEVLAVGGWLGNSRNGGNVALLLCLCTHMVSALFTTADYFRFGCVFSLPALGSMVLLTAYMFWAGAGRIYMPPTQMPGNLVSGTSRDPFHDD